MAATGGLITAIGTAADPAPAATTVLRADGCLVTPGLINTHHHIFQNLTRSLPPRRQRVAVHLAEHPLSALGRPGRGSHLPVGTWVGLAELALGGCTTTTDHLYVHPKGGGHLISAEIGAARELGLRFHPTRGSMSLSEKDGGLPPDSVVQDDDEILADSERLVAATTTPPGAPWSASPWPRARPSRSPPG